MSETADLSFFTDASEGLLAQAFLANCISAVQLDLQTGRGLVLKDDLDKGLVGTVLTWPGLIEYYVQKRVCPSDREKLLSVTLEQIKKSCQEGTGGFPLELHCYFEDGTIQWVRVAVTSAGTDGNTVMLTTRFRAGHCQYADSPYHRDAGTLRHLFFYQQRNYQ